MNDPDTQAAGPVVVYETGLPAEPGPGQEFKDIAITMGMPSLTGQDFETLRPRFKDTFGTTFTEETRPMQVFAVTRARGVLTLVLFARGRISSRRGRFLPINLHV